MRTFNHLFARLLLGLSVTGAAALGGCAGAESEDDASEEAAANLEAGRNFGPIEAGTTKNAAHGGRVWGRYTFKAKRGDVVDFWVHASEGDAIAALLNARQEVVTNDNGSAATKDAHVSAVIQRDGSYDIAFAEKTGRSTNFKVTFERPPPAGSVSLDDLIDGGKFLFEGATIPNVPPGSAKVTITAYPNGYGNDRSIVAVAAVSLSTGESAKIALKLNSDQQTLGGSAYADSTHRSFLSMTRGNGVVSFQINIVHGDKNRVLLGTKITKR